MSAIAVNEDADNQKPKSYDFGILLSDNPTVFKYTHSEGSAPNYAVLTGDSAAHQLEQINQFSNIEVVDKSDWNLAGFAIKQDSRGRDVIVRQYDKTKMLLEKKEQQAQQVEEAEDKTVDAMMKRIEMLEEQLKSQAAEKNAIAKAELEAAEKAESDKRAKDMAEAEAEILKQQEEKQAKEEEMPASKKPAAKRTARKLAAKK